MKTGVYIQKIYNDGVKGQLNYNILYPNGFKINSGTKNPLIVFLHGAGERGDDNLAQLKHISKNFLDDDFTKKHQAIVIFPQCPEGDYWANKSERFLIDSKSPPKESMRKVIDLINSFRSLSYIDKNRIYLTGLSMGGMGTFDLLSRKPEWFAAAVSVCGAADLDVVEKYKHIPMKIFHGAKDEVVPAERSQAAYNALRALNAPVELEVYPNGGHDIWNKVYDKNKVIEWMLNQKKR